MSAAPAGFVPLSRCAPVPVQQNGRGPGQGIPRRPAGVGFKHPGLSVNRNNVSEQYLCLPSLAFPIPLSCVSSLKCRTRLLKGFFTLLCFAATGDRGAQRVPRRGGDFPGVLCLGAADYANADGERVSMGALLGLLGMKVLAQPFHGELWKRSIWLCKNI